MSYSPVSVDSWEGLDMVESPLDMGLSRSPTSFNVDIDGRGRLRRRPGILRQNSIAAAAAYFDCIPVRNGVRVDTLAFRISAATIAVDSIAENSTVVANIGSVAATSPSTSWGIASSCQLGTPTNSYAFFTISATTAGAWPLLQKVTNLASVGASVGKPWYVAVTPWDNRLVQAGYHAVADTPSGANGGGSTVFFADPVVKPDGTVTTGDVFTSTNWLQLEPGNGEAIRGMLSWGDYLFVAKDSCLYVFYGTSTDATGSPVFNYRKLQLPYPLLTKNSTGGAGNILAPSGVMVGGPDGVYVLTEGGIFRTAGDGFEKVSAAIEPVFREADTEQWTSFYGMDIVGDYLFLRHAPTGATGDVLVYNIARRAWNLWRFAAGAPRRFIENIFGADGTGIGGILRPNEGYLHAMKVTAADDAAGTAIASSFASGWSDMDSPDEKVMRGFELRHIGAPSIGIGSDNSNTILDSGAPLAALSANALSADAGDNASAPVRYVRSLVRTAYRGRRFAYEISGAGPWRVDQIIFNLRDKRDRR